MRLDKYLKTCRILKRRITAKELAQNKRILLNDKYTKGSSNIKENDKIQIFFGDRLLTIRVIMIKKQVSKEEASQMFTVEKEVFVNEQ